MLIETISQVINILLVLLCIVCWIAFIMKFIKNKNATVKTVNAVVTDKYTQKVSFKSGLNSVKYVVVFLAEGKKLSFTVSEFTYPEYKVKEKGILKYKGNSIMDFS